jgi:hypothetical protein
LDFFLENMAAVNNEYGKRFHQDMSQMEKRLRWKMESKYVGRLLQVSLVGDTNW